MFEVTKSHKRIGSFPMILDIFEFEFSQTLSPYPSFLSLLGYSIYVSINVSSCSPSSFLPSILHISLDFFACLANWIVLRCGCLSAAVPRDLCEFSDLPAFFGWFALFPSLLSTLPSGVWFLNKKARKRLFRAFFEHRRKNAEKPEEIAINFNISHHLHQWNMNFRLRHWT